MLQPLRFITSEQVFQCKHLKFHQRPIRWNINTPLKNQLPVQEKWFRTLQQAILNSWPLQYIHRWVIAWNWSGNAGFFAVNGCAQGLPHRNQHFQGWLQFLFKFNQLQNPTENDQIEPKNSCKTWKWSFTWNTNKRSPSSRRSRAKLQ